MTDISRPIGFMDRALNDILRAMRRGDRPIGVTSVRVSLMARSMGTTSLRTSFVNRPMCLALPGMSLACRRVRSACFRASDLARATSEACVGSNEN
jgi:hypothetical protein